MRVISRLSGETVEVFDADLESSRVFPNPFGAGEWSVSWARDAVVYGTDDTVIRIGPDGREWWRFVIGPRALDGDATRISVAFSADDALVWVFAPNLLAGRGASDEWITLDAVTGEERGRRPVPSAGLGGSQFALRDGRMLLDVGEGQDGTQIFLAGVAGEVHDYGWGDRVLIDVSPDERQFMTVDHDGQQDVVFHDFPGGEPRFRLGAADFGEDPEVAVIEWTGGYLDADTAIVVLVGEDEEFWWRHYRVDVRTGEVLGGLGIVTIDEDDLQPLGDGTYVITDTDETLRRM